MIQQSARRNFYRGENDLYPESIPTLLRNLKKYDNQKDRELYCFVADMRVAEFKAFLRKFDHVKNWNYCDVLYDALAQHYGLETGWLDITNDFNEALYRNHYYRMEDRQQCLKDIENFEINGHKIKITTGHSWNLSSGRRKKIDAAYNDFSLEKDYGIQIIERKQVTEPSGMYEPWMLASSADEPGIADFKVREHVGCEDRIDSIVTRYMDDNLGWHKPSKY